MEIIIQSNLICTKKILLGAPYLHPLTILPVPTSSETNNPTSNWIEDKTANQNYDSNFWKNYLLSHTREAQ